jgi:hypothetical protein
MGWLGEEDEKYLKPFVREFIDAYEYEATAREQRQEAEDTLLNSMAAYELSEIRHGKWRIIADFPRGKEAGIIMIRRKTIELV